jgi:hypothetical protein
MSDMTRLLARLMQKIGWSALNAGTEHLARGGRTDAEMSPEDRARQRATRRAMAQAKRAARLGRRFFR